MEIRSNSDKALHLINSIERSSCLKDISYFNPNNEEIFFSLKKCEKAEIPSEIEKRCSLILTLNSRVIMISFRIELIANNILNSKEYDCKDALDVEEKKAEFDIITDEINNILDVIHPLNCEEKKGDELVSLESRMVKVIKNCQDFETKIENQLQKVSNIPFTNLSDQLLEKQKNEKKLTTQYLINFGVCIAAIKLMAVNVFKSVHTGLSTVSNK